MKADEPRQNRIPFMMSDRELSEIDDWRFANKIATRAEAIRRLCQMGLQAEEPISKISEELNEFFLAMMARINDLAKAESEGHPRLIEEEQFSDTLKSMIELFDRLYDLRSTVRSLDHRIWAMREGGDFDESMAQADRAVEIHKQSMKLLQDIAARKGSK